MFAETKGSDRRLVSVMSGYMHTADRWSYGMDLDAPILEASCRRVFVSLLLKPLSVATHLARAYTLV